MAAVPPISHLPTTSQQPQEPHPPVSTPRNTTERHHKWSTIPAKSIGSSQIIYVQAEDTVQKAFEKLLEENILSAPIFDPAKGKFIGLIDFVDIVFHLVSHFKDGKEELQTWREVIKAKNDFFSTPIKQISDLSQRNPFVSIPEDASLLDAMKVLAQGVKRVCLVSEKGSLVSIVTQSSVVSHFCKHHKDIGEKKNKTIQELGLGIKTIFSIKEKERAIDAFKLMAKEQVSSVAVLDDTGKLVGHISARDLKGIKVQFYSFNTLFHPVIELLKVIRNEELVTHVPIFTCLTTDTIYELLQKVGVPRLHKIYLRDENHNPHGVITLTDILQELLKDY